MEHKAISEKVNINSDILEQRVTRSMTEIGNSALEDKEQSHLLSRMLEQSDHLHTELRGQIQLIDKFQDAEDIDAVARELGKWEEFFRKFHTSANACIDKLDSKKEKDDAIVWYQTESNKFNKFKEDTCTWMKQRSPEVSLEVNHNVRPIESASQVGSHVSSVHSSKVNALAKTAEIMATQKKLKEIHLLEQEERMLRQRREEEERMLRQRREEEESTLRQRREEEETVLRQRKESLELETELEIANAQFEIYDRFDTQSKVVDSYPRRVSSLNPQVLPFRPSQPQLEETRLNPIPRATEIETTNISHTNQSFRDLRPSNIQHTQETDLVQLIIDHQKLSSLPVRKIPTFSGNPVEYKTFLRSFEHGIEDKTSSPKDRLYFLDQYTSGEPNDLVRSCIHMDPVVGYETARSLLDKKFGNKYKLATAYMDKAVNWPSIKPEDAEAMTSFSIFLTSCGNTMKDIEYMRELDHPKNLRDLLEKLPYKLRDKWRSVSHHILEKRNVTFADLVEFVDKQAQILSNPIFGNIVENRPQYKKDESEKPKKFSSYATEAEENEEVEEKRYSVSKALTTPCWFCKDEHTLERCKEFQCKPLKEKIEFLGPKGVCFRCLQFGHVSKGCPRRLTCQICKRTHATCFHDNTKDQSTDWNESARPKRVTSNSVAAIPVTTPSREVSCMPVVPVRIKSKNSGACIETYAFIDNGSSASFCTERLAKELRVKGKRTEIIVNTMNQRNSVNTTMIEGLEVAGIDGSKWINLPSVYTQDKMPISRSTIPKQKSIDQWPHLRDISLVPLDAEIGLLIGNNIPKAMEPQEVIKSENNGPYAVRTVLGWTINGLVQESGAGVKEVSQNYISVIREDMLVDETPYRETLRRPFRQERLRSVRQETCKKEEKVMPPNELVRCRKPEIRESLTVRHTVSPVVREQTLDKETSQTVVCETVPSINRAYDDPGDLEALPPNHLLLKQRMPALPPGMVEDNYPRCRRRGVQNMAGLSWKRWTKEYLLLLQERQKRVKLRRNLQRGDVVLIMDYLDPRSSWAMTDSTGVVRTVRVRTQSSELVRPIRKLCLLLESDICNV